MIGKLDTCDALKGKGGAFPQVNAKCQKQFGILQFGNKKKQFPGLNFENMKKYRASPFFWSRNLNQTLKRRSV
jgi:hypothetical protein